MSVLTGWGGDGLAVGPLTIASAGTGDTAPGFITGAVPRIELVDRRSPAIRFETPTADPNYAAWAYSAVDLYAYTTRIYYHPVGIPAAGLLALFQHTNAGETLASHWVAIGSDAKLRLLDKNGGEVALGTPTLTALQWYRIELVVNGGAHALHLFTGESATALQVLEVDLPTPVAGGRLRVWNSFGSQAGIAGYIDDIAVSDQPALIGPVSVNYSSYYTTPAAVREVLAAAPTTTTDGQTAASFDDESLIQAIRDASGEINGYLGGRYATPVVPVDGEYSPVVVWMATSSAAWYATLTHRKSKDIEDDDPVQRRRTAVMKLLEGVSKGDIDLPLPPPTVVGDTGAFNLWEGELFDHRDWLPGEPYYRGAQPVAFGFPNWWDPAWGRYPF